MVEVCVSITVLNNSILIIVATLFDVQCFEKERERRK